MSDEKNRKEAGRWLATANDDLESARILKKSGQYAHACFHAQQAAEKSLKAVWIHEDADPWGHSIKKLIDDLESVNLTTHQYFDQYAHSGLVLDWLTPMLAQDLVDFGDTDLAKRLLLGGLPPFYLSETLPERNFQDWVDGYWNAVTPSSGFSNC